MRGEADGSVCAGALHLTRRHRGSSQNAGKTITRNSQTVEQIEQILDLQQRKNGNKPASVCHNFALGVICKDPERSMNGSKAHLREGGGVWFHVFPDT